MESSTDIRDLLLAPALSDEEVAELLRPYGFAEPSVVDTILQRMCPIPADRMALADALVPLLEGLVLTANPVNCLIQLERIAESFGQRAGLYRTLAGDPASLNTLLAVLSSSRSLADVLVIHPEYLGIVWDSSALADTKTLDEMRLEASAATSVFEEKAARIDALRRMRRREYLRIGARELTSYGSFREVVQEISDLASALVAETLAVCHESLAFTGENKPDPFAVVAFGKWGAGELNYSSDIDIAIVWDNPPADLDDQYSQFYNRLAQTLIDELSRLSAEGRMYRVDLRLRPYGNSGPIGMAVSEFLNYYESYSEPWERQALIKAKTVTGPPGLRMRVDTFLQDFAYSRRMDSSSIAQVLSIKEKSESFRSKDGEMDLQVKHGWGGIRDVEFTVQLLQLVGGNKMQQLRKPATLDAIDALQKESILTYQEATILEAAYVFLRQVEHCLQIADELPIQTFPQDELKQRQIALSLGYRDEQAPAQEQLVSDYRTHTASVRKIHLRLFQQFSLSSQGTDITKLITGTEDNQDILRGYGIDKPEAAIRTIRGALFQSGPSQITTDAQKRFLEIADDLLTCVKNSPDPDLSVQWMFRMAEATGSPLEFFRSVGASEQALQIFANLAGSSEFLSGILTRRPEYLDRLSDPAALANPASLSMFMTELQQRTEVEGSVEGKLNALRRYRLREFLRIGIRDVAGIAEVGAITTEISLLAEACLCIALDIAVKAAGGWECLPGSLTVLGMGKLGGRELHYASDLDLVCVYTESSDNGDAFRTFEKIVRALMDNLQRVTAEGVGFQVDMRLRPEGNAGMLATDFDGYCRYLDSKVQAWERQALVRSRPVAGDMELAGKLKECIDDAVWGKPFTNEDLEEIRHIKRRIENERSKQSSDLIDLKRGPGGILDIEFTAQALQLAWGAVHPELRTPGTVNALVAMGEIGVIDPADASQMVESYLFLRHAENRLQVATDRSEDGVSTQPDRLATFARRMGYPANDGDPATDFLNDLEHHTAPARKLHEKYFFETPLSRDAWGAPEP